MRENWRDEAACSRSDVDPELFTAREQEDLGGRPTPEYVQRALDICATCPVIEDCREFADTRTDALTVGVWGHEYRSRRLAGQRQRLSGKGPFTAVQSRPVRSK